MSVKFEFMTELMGELAKITKTRVVLVGNV